MTDLSKLCRKYHLKFSIYSNSDEWDNGDYSLVFLCEFSMPNPYRKGHYKAYLNDDSLIHYTVDDEVDSEVAHFPKFKITSFDLFVKAVASILDKNEITDDDWDY